MRWRAWWATIGLVVLLAGCGEQAPAQPAAQAPEAFSPLPAASPDAAQREAMNDPKQVVVTFADLVQQQRYAEVEPLMTDFLRQAFVQGAGSVEAGFRAGESDDGQLVSYTIGDVRSPDANTAEVEIDWTFQQRQTKSTILLTQEQGAWKVANIKDR
ncbi:MAG TPA: hypothetical protein VGD69_13390 [Herpetosiphonaceae bacterium]